MNSNSPHSRTHKDLLEQHTHTFFTVQSLETSTVSLDLVDLMFILIFGSASPSAIFLYSHTQHFLSLPRKWPHWPLMILYLLCRYKILQGQKFLHWDVRRRSAPTPRVYHGWEMARAGLNAILLSKLARYAAVSNSLACAINREGFSIITKYSTYYMLQDLLW